MLSSLTFLADNCARSVGGSTSENVLQLVEDLMEPKPDVELHAVLGILSTDGRLRQLDIYRSRTSDRGLPSLN